MKQTISFNIDVTDLAILDDYAKNLERDRTYVLQDAVKRYIAEQEREHAENEKAMRGPFYTTDEVMVHLKEQQEFRRRRRAS